MRHVVAGLLGCSLALSTATHAQQQMKPGEVLVFRYLDLYYKSLTGPTKENYVALFALTRASRDKYWPGASDSDDLRAAFTPAVKALTKELSISLVEGSYLAAEKFAAALYESRDWADFALVSPAR